MKVVVLGLSMTISSAASATSGQCTEWVAKVVSIEGRVETRPQGDENWHPTALNDTYCAGDELRTLENSRAALQFSNETIIRLDQNTMVKFVAAEPEVPLLLRLFNGKAFFMTRFPRPLTIETPFVNAASGGTEYVVEVNEADGTTTVKVIEGTVNLENSEGRLTLTDEQSSVTRAGEAPVPHLMVTRRDALQWALYYPPVLSVRDLGLESTAGRGATDWRTMVRESIAAYQDGNLEAAFTAIAEAPEGIGDPRFYDYRASLRLSVGRVEEARADIQQALDLSPGNGLALALRSIIAVVGNDADKALQLALAAVNAGPDSASVQIALSYAYQAKFNLPESLAAARTANELDPEFALAWARTAELWMTQGYLEEALSAAHHAERLNPREVRYQTVLGFAYLTQIRVSEAKAVFEKAVQLNSADPMPRLGLGLAKIRRGDLEGGRQDIEIAAALDPVNALIRSYLGKAYYEEKRDPKAAIQFDLAKKLDPNDPTPYTYDAVRRQTTNRPVEALRDVETAIELNDNRAVYRSRLLLDDDLASRSVSRGRIYQTLGFGQLAVIDALRSVNTDPMNYSAQRFLADSYATLPYSEIARQSALLTSQLLQPINNSPVQPSLSNDSVLQAESGAPSAAFNEYSQLFESDRVQLLASGLAGSNNTWGDELIANGVHDWFSWSLGQFRYLTDGYRENANIDQTIYDLFLQGQITPKLSLQTDFQVNNNNHGYLSLHYDPAIYAPTYNIDTKDRTYRAGAHYALNPTSDVLLSVLYQNYDEQQVDSGVFIPALASSFATDDQIARLYEAQYLSDVGWANIIAGTGYYSGDDNVEGSVVIKLPPPFGGVSSLKDATKTRHANAYLYALIAITRKFQLSVGGSYDRFRDDKLQIDDSQFSPKLGVLWDIRASTSLRLVGLKAYTRDIISNQTIEPTQVAGFQQFFDDVVGSKSKLYGIGLDHRFSTKASSGIEYTKRDVTSPFFINVVPPVIDKYMTRVKTGRAYYYRSLSDHFTTTVNYYYEQTKDDLNDISIDTQRVPVGIKLFYPIGFFAGLTGSYIDQSGDVIDPISGAVVSTASHFWVMDASIGYRLPNRRGIASIEVRNLTDRQFLLQQSSPTSDNPNEIPFVYPERFVTGKITFTFD